MARGRGATIQRTADMGGLVGAKKILKIFKKGVKTRKIGVREVPEGGLGGTLDRACGAIFGSRNEVSAVPLEVQ